jgi:hypothetical protein
VLLGSLSYGIVGIVPGINGMGVGAGEAVSRLGQGGLVKGFNGLIPTGQGRGFGTALAGVPTKVGEEPSGEGAVWGCNKAGGGVG